MALTCQNCGDEIPKGQFGGPEEAVEEDIIDEIVAHTFDPTDSIAVAETAFYCDPECFVESHV